MSVQEIQSKIKGFLTNEKAFSIALLVAIASASFGMGRVSNLVTGEDVTSKTPDIQETASAILSSEPALNTIAPKVSTKEETPIEQKISAPQQATDTKGVYVASKNGTKYHLPWCSGAKNIKEENKVWFASKEEAQSKGYSAAANCKGI